MVMGDDSCLKRYGFKSRRHILAGHFFTLVCCKNCIVSLKRLKINEKEAGVGTFKKTNLRHLRRYVRKNLTELFNFTC